MEPAGQRDDVMAQRGVGHRIGHHRLNVLPARGAVVAVDRVLSDHRLDLLGNVFNDALARPFASLQLPAAAGADREAMLDSWHRSYWASCGVIRRVLPELPAASCALSPPVSDRAESVPRAWKPMGMAAAIARHVPPSPGRTTTRPRTPARAGHRPVPVSDRRAWPHRECRLNSEIVVRWKLSRIMYTMPRPGAIPYKTRTLRLL